MIKSNRKLVIVIIALIAILLLAAGLGVFIAQDTSKYVNKAFDKLGEDSFKSVDVLIKENDVLVFSDVDGVLYNPLELNYENEDKLYINFDSKYIKGKRIQDKNLVKLEGKITDSVAFLGKEVEDLKVSYVVDIEKEEVKVLSLKYSDNGFDIEIVAKAK